MGVPDENADGERPGEKVVRELDPGSVVSVHTPGAGEYNDPADRDPAAVCHDVELGKDSIETA
ncbi:hypothetical protein DMJ13_18890 [halophilic archaeon]|nr:hypothetical protein DMJ13_18890 [halophilic archaeon]